MQTELIEDRISGDCRYNAARLSRMSRRAKKSLPSLIPLDNATAILQNCNMASVRKEIDKLLEKGLKAREIKRMITGKRKGLDSQVIAKLYHQLQYAMH